MSNVAEFNIQLTENFQQTFKDIERNINTLNTRLAGIDKNFGGINKTINKSGVLIKDKVNVNIGKGSNLVNNLLKKVSLLSLGFIGVSKAIHYMNDSLDMAMKKKIMLEKFSDEMGRFKTRINLSSKEFDRMASDISKVSRFSRTQVMEVGIKAIRMKGMTKEKMQDTMKTALGLSEREGIPLEQSISVMNKVMGGRPTEALEAMRSSGVPVTKEMQRLMTTLELTGQYSQATAKNMSFLTAQYKGFAEEIAQRDPMFAFNKSMERSKELLGGVLLDLKMKFMNALSGILDKFNSLLTFVKDNKDTLAKWVKGIAAAVGGLATSFTLYKIALEGALIKTVLLNGATKVWGVLQAIVTGNLWKTVAALGGINVATGGIIILIGALVTGLILLITNWEKSVIYIKYWAGVTWEKIKQWSDAVKEIFVAIGGTIKDAFTLNWGDIKGRWDTAFENIANKAKSTALNIAELKKNFNKSLEDLDKEKEAAASGSKNNKIKIDSATYGVGQAQSANINAAAPKVFVLNVQQLNGVNVHGNIVGKHVESEVKNSMTSLVTELTNALAELQTGNL